MDNKIRFVFGVLFVFFYIYFPPILSINTIYVLMGVCIVYLFGCGVFKRTASIDNKANLSFLLYCMFLCMWTMIMGKLNGFGYQESINDLLLITFGFTVSAIAFNLYCINSDFSNDEIFHIILVAAIIQSGFCFYAYFNPSFQSWFIQKMVSYGYSETRFTQLSAFRWYGLATQLGFATPVVQTMLSVICLYKGILMHNNKYYLTMIVLLLSAVINARIAVILFAIGLIVVMLYLFQKQKKMIIRFIAFFIVFLIISILVLRVMKSYSYANYNWIVSGVLSFLGFEVDTTNAYVVGDYFSSSEKYRLPAFFDSVLGFGVTPVKLNIGFATDIGFVNDIWKYGIFLSFLIYYYIFKCSRKLSRIGLTEDTFPRTLIVVFLCICNIKGNIIAATPISAVFIIFICGFRSIKTDDKTL